MRTLTATFYTPNGNSVEVFDYKALQSDMNAVDSALNVLQQNANIVDERLKQLENQVIVLDSFIKWVAEHRSETLRDYLLTLRAKDRVGATQAPSQSELDATLERYRYMRP